MAATALLCHLLFYVVENTDSTASDLCDYVDSSEYGKKHALVLYITFPNHRYPYSLLVIDLRFVIRLIIDFCLSEIAPSNSISSIGSIYRFSLMAGGISHV